MSDPQTTAEVVQFVARQKLPKYETTADRINQESADIDQCGTGHVNGKAAIVDRYTLEAVYYSGLVAGLRKGLNLGVSGNEYEFHSIHRAWRNHIDMLNRKRSERMVP